MIATGTPIEIRKAATSRIGQVDWNNLGFGKVFSDHMLVMEYRDGQWHAPVIQPYGPMSFSPAISALHYGQAIFEGLKAFRNEQGEAFIFRPAKNAHRMNTSARRLCMPEMPEELFVDAVHELVKLDKAWIPGSEGSALYIRPHMFSTDEYVGVKPSDTYLFVIFTCPVGKYYTGELKVKIEPKFTRAAKGGTGHAKAAGNYAASLWPTRMAQEEGFNQILWTDGQTHEYFEESGTMNVIFRSGNRIITPMVSDSILDGVTRDSVLTLARDWGYEVEERKVSVKEILALYLKDELDEVFGAGTAATIAPIRTIHYAGNDLNLRPFESWEFAPKVGDYLDRLKRGLEPDLHQWNLRV